MSRAHENDLSLRLRQSDLLTDDQLRELSRSVPATASPASIAGFLTRRGWLTRFQADHLLHDRMDRLSVGGYRLLEPIGAGGMGEVFRAVQIKLKRMVALKVIRKEVAASNSRALARFRREALAVAKLSHPNIVVIYDAGESDGIDYIAMEYLTGLDLAQLVARRGPLPIAVACDLVRQAALGLQHAHEHGLVHRDIKPSNLFVTLPGADLSDDAIDERRGLVKILDLGLARINSETRSSKSSLTQELAVLGTPDYISPEQSRDGKSADIRSDLYSLGCTLYFLLVGHPPFPGGTPMEKLTRHQAEHPRPAGQLRPEVPKAVEGILRRLMAKRREDRFQTPLEVASALGKELGLAPLVASNRSGKPASTPTAAPQSMPSVAAVAAVQKQLRSERTKAPAIPDAAPTEVMLRPPSLPTQLSSASVGSRILAGRHPSIHQAVTADPWIDLQSREWAPQSKASRVAVLQGHQGPVVALSFSHRGKSLATGGLDHAIQLWSLRAKEFQHVNSFQDERLGEIQSLELSVGGERLLIAARGLGGRVWQWRLEDRVSGELHSLDGAAAGGLAVSPKGDFIAAADGRDVTIWKSSARAPQRLSTDAGRGPVICCSAFSHDGQCLFCGDAEGFIQSWKLAWRKFRTDRVFAAHAGPVHGLAVAGDGKHMATAGADNTVRVWSVEGEPELVAVISPTLRGLVRRLRFRSGKDTLMMVSDAGQVAEWRCIGANKKTEWSLEQIVTSSQAISDHGRLVALGHTDGTVHVYQLQTKSSLHDSSPSL